MNETAFQRVLDALGPRVRRQNSHDAAAHCPAHEDRNPSLSISNGDGRVLLHCQAGCHPEDVTAAIGLTMADLFDEPKQDERPTIVARYPYTDASGTILFTKVRYFPKDFRVDPPGVAGKLDRKPLYRLPELLQAIQHGDPVWIVEGEKDADRLRTLGQVATCNYDGAAKDKQRPKWRPDYRYSEYLTGAKVTIIADRDAAGLAHAAAIRADLTGKAAVIRIVQSATTREHDDISDHLDAGYTIHQLIEVDDATTEPAEDLNLEAVRRAIPAIDWYELWTRPDEDEEWIVEPLLPARRLIALYSPPKMGKSILMLELAAAIATGRDVLGVHTIRQRILYVDFENDPAQDTRERLKAMGYGPDDLTDLVLVSFPNLATLDTAQGGIELMALVAAYNCQVIIIDTVSRAIKGDENENDTWLHFYRHTGLLLKQAGIALVRLDHAGKDVTKGQRGGSAKSGDVDAVWRLDIVGEDTFMLRCEAHRFRLNETEVAFRRQGFPLASIVDANPKKAAAEANERMWEKCLNMAHVAKPVSQREARRMIKAAGLNAGRTEKDSPFARFLRKYNGGLDVVGEAS